MRRSINFATVEPQLCAVGLGFQGKRKKIADLRCLGFTLLLRQVALLQAHCAAVCDRFVFRFALILSARCWIWKKGSLLIMQTFGHKLKQRKFQLTMRKNFFPLRVTEPWPRLPREVVESPSLEIFKPRLDKVLCSLL